MTTKNNSNVVIEVQSAPYDIWEFLEDCESLEQGYERLDELEDEATKKKLPSTWKYRISWKKR